MPPNENGTAATPYRDPALLAAWRRFLDYDRVSTQQKSDYQRIRRWVLLLGFAASLAAVVSIYNRAGEWYGSGTVGELLRMGLIVLPIISVALMNYAAQFATSTAWIEYRVGAETIRSQIYLYRMKAGIYSEKDMVSAREHLVETVSVADKRIEEQNVTLPYMQPLDDDTIEERISKKTDNPEHDNGLKPLTVDEYIVWRLLPQLNWYISKIQRDYHRVRQNRIIALVIAGTGAVISGLMPGFEGFVAVTTALGVAFTLWAEINMYGATYSIFHWTATKLQNELSQWQILEAEDRNNFVNQRNFVSRVEFLFEEEKELWRSQAIQAQMQADEAITSSLPSSDDTLLYKLDDYGQPVFVSPTSGQTSLEAQTAAALQPLLPDDSDFVRVTEQPETEEDETAATGGNEEEVIDDKPDDLEEVVAMVDEDTEDIDEDTTNVTVEVASSPNGHSDPEESETRAS